MKIVMVSVSTYFWGVLLLCVTAKAHIEPPSRLLETVPAEAIPTESYSDPHPPPYYGPPPKLVEAKVLTQQAKFILGNPFFAIGGFVKITEGVSLSFKSATSLIAKAKEVLGYKDKDYSCELLELSKNLIEAALSPRFGSLLIIPSVFERVNFAQAQVEAHIKWLKSQSGFPTQEVNDALYALIHAIGVLDALSASAVDLGNHAQQARAAIEVVDVGIEDALQFCQDDSHQKDYYRSNQYDSIDDLKNALGAIHDAIKLAETLVNELTANLNVFLDESLSSAIAAIDKALQAIINAIEPNKGY